MKDEGKKEAVLQLLARQPLFYVFFEEAAFDPVYANEQMESLPLPRAVFSHHAGL